MPKKQGGKNSKMGRNAVKCKKYYAEGRREKNKIKKILKHLKRCSEDRQARVALYVLKPTHSLALKG